MDSNDTSSIINFNEIQQQLAETFNPQTAKERTKEIFANLLLGMGVPFFAERLKEKLPEDMFKKIAELLKDPENLGKNSLEFAKKVFQDKFLEPVKNELLDKLSDHIPELKGIDITKASLTDIQNTLTKGVIERMKAKLPAEIADNLPENFTRDDILNAVKTLGRDKALQFAKDNLPPEAYTELERNQEILTDPARISDFVKGKLNDLQGQVETNFKNVKATVQGRIDEVKTAIKGKIDEATAEARGKLDTIMKARDDAKSTWRDLKGQLRDNLNSAQQKLDEYKANNPMHTDMDEPVMRLQNEIEQAKQNAKLARDNFLDTDADYATQIEDMQGNIDNITKNLVAKVGNIRATIGAKAQELAQKGEEVVAKAKELPAAIQAEGEKIIPKIPSEARGGTMFNPEEMEKQAGGFFDRLNTFVGEKKSQFMDFIGKGKQQVVNPESGDIQFENKFSMLQADEPESVFTEGAMRGVMRNAGLATYYGTEITPADQLIDKENTTKILPYRAKRPIKVKQEQPPKEKPLEQPKPTEPQFSPEELKAAEQARIAGETARPQQVLPTIPKPEEPTVEVKAPKPVVTEERPVIPEGEAEVKLPGIGTAVEGVGIGMGIYQLEQGIAERNPAQEVGGGVPLGTTAVSTAIRQAQAPPPPVEQQAPKPTTVQPEQLGEQGITPKSTTVTPQAKPQSAISNETEGEIIGQQTEKTAIKEGGTILGEEGGEEGLFAGILAGASEVPILGALVDIGGILGSIFGAKALMGGKAPPPPNVSGSAYEPNL